MNTTTTNYNDPTSPVYGLDGETMGAQRRAEIAAAHRLVVAANERVNACKDFDEAMESGARGELSNALWNYECVRVGGGK